MVYTRAGISQVYSSQVIDVMVKGRTEKNVVSEQKKKKKEKSHRFHCHTFHSSSKHQTQTKQSPVSYLH